MIHTQYYTAIGPLPNRLQAPRWRSPTTSPAKSKGSCPRHGSGGSGVAHNTGETDADTGRQTEIASHKQAISRHRHHWERARTPPGYWNIGFPDTQEAADINERASEMHRQKREAVEKEVRKGAGRYKRRQGT
jgi:DNA repair protein endonuclease SAE2/CtIP C-terminus